jgi:hypothetical protein
LKNRIPAVGELGTWRMNCDFMAITIAGKVPSKRVTVMLLFITCFKRILPPEIHTVKPVLVAVCVGNTRIEWQLRAVIARSESINSFLFSSYVYVGFS